MKSETKIIGSALFCAVIFTFLVTKVSSMYNNRDKYSVGDCISSSEFYKDKLDVEEVLKVGKEEYLVRNISRHGSVIHSYKANRDKWWANSSYFLVEKEYCEQ
jgi:hypothetical protein